MDGEVLAATAREGVSTSDWQPFVSVVLCTRDRADDLRRSLTAVLEVDYPTFEVVVVDQSTDDDSTRGAVQEILLQHTAWRICHSSDKESAPSPAARVLKYHRAVSRGLSRARNDGLCLATGEVVAFTDDDCGVPPTWISRAVAVLAGEPDAGVVFGSLIPVIHDPDRDYIPTFLPDAYRVLRGTSLDCQPGAGANMVFRRGVFGSTGGFDEWLGAGSRFPSAEDLLMAHRALRSGFAVIQDPANPVRHWGARRVATGDSHKIKSAGYYSTGAGYAWYGFRQGDLGARSALWREASALAKLSLSNLIATGRPSGARLLAWLVRGALEGMAQPRRAVVSSPAVRPVPDQPRR